MTRRRHPAAAMAGSGMGKWGEAMCGEVKADDAMTTATRRAAAGGGGEGGV